MLRKIYCMLIFFTYLASSFGIRETSKTLKYSKEYSSEERPYRSRKATLIWEKAQKHFQSSDDHDKSQLAELAHELKSLDEELMNYKVIVHNEGDPEGEIQNSLESKVEGLLVRYGLSSKFGKRTQSNRVDDQRRQQDELGGLLSRAEKLGFSDEDMANLKTEIDHHKRKMRDLESLMEELNQMQKLLLSEKNELDNTRPRDPETLSKIKKLKIAVKDKEKDVQDGRSRLNLMSEIPISAQDSVFTDPKVMRLWADVLRGNFSDEERESLKEELHHLENKIVKRAKLTEQLDLVKKHSAENKRIGDADSGEGLVKKHRDLMDKTAQLNHHVDKYERDLKYRISMRKHLEL